MKKIEIIHDGVSKKVYATDEPDKVIIQYTDAITAYYKIKRALIKDKGLYCNAVSSMVFTVLKNAGVPMHFIERLSDTEQLCRRVDSIQMEVIVRNVVAGSMAKRLGMDEGIVLKEPIVDLCYKTEDLGDPLINDYHAIALGLVTKEELAVLYSLAEKVNAVLTPLFRGIGITLVDFKIEFGRLPDGQIILSDDITPDSARFWDIETGMKLDKDRFRHDNGKVGQAYRTVYERLKEAVK